MSGLLRRIDGLLSEPGTDDERLRLTADGDDRPAWAAVSYGFLEATHHCADIGVLRDLYRERHRA